MTTPTPRVLVPSAAAKGEVIQVRTIISHQMETGLRHDVKVRSSRARSSTGSFAAMAVKWCSVSISMRQFRPTPLSNSICARRTAGGLSSSGKRTGAESIAWNTNSRSLDDGVAIDACGDVQATVRGRVVRRSKPLERTTTNGARLILALLMATSPSFVVHQSAAAENNQGAQLAAMCAACHRLDGRDQGIPSIIGLNPKKLTEAMEAFRSGKRSSQIMNVVARSLSTEEIAALAEYLATQKRGSEQP